MYFWQVISRFFRRKACFTVWLTYTQKRIRCDFWILKVNGKYISFELYFLHIVNINCYILLFCYIFFFVNIWLIGNLIQYSPYFQLPAALWNWLMANSESDELVAKLVLFLYCNKSWQIIKLSWKMGQNTGHHQQEANFILFCQLLWYVMCQLRQLDFI